MRKANQSEQVREHVSGPVRSPIVRRSKGQRTGGTAGNLALTSATGVLLFVLLAIEGVTVPFVRQMMVIHIFVGYIMIPVVALKLGSTGYRFMRYYLGDDRYVAAGPPMPLLRVLGPIVIASTVLLLGSGVELMILGPYRGGTFDFLHKAAFVVWFGAMTIHVLAYVLRAMQTAWADWSSARGWGHSATGSRLRRTLVVTALVVGVGLAVVTLPVPHSWVVWAHVT